MGNIHIPTDNVYIGLSVNSPITAASNNGAVVNGLGYTRALAIFDTSPSGSGTTSDMKLQEGTLANGSDMADVASATFTEGTTVLGHTTQGMNIDMSKRKQYLRLVHTGAGGSAAGQVVGTILLFNGEGLPPTQAVTPVSI